MPASDAYARVCRSFRSPWLAAGVASNTPVLLGLSGGADSRLLLHRLAEICQASGAPLHAAHLHHGIRGAEADRDEQFCRELAERYGAAYHVQHIDVPAFAKERGESLETAAREARYAFFADVMRQQSIPLLVTAHHADDNLETVILRLCRGSGGAGLCGIAPSRPFERAAGAMVVRPLLDCRKADILDACAELSLDYVIDSTNDDPAYARNLVRTQVLPALNRLVAHPELQVSRSCATLREDEELLSSLAEQFFCDLPDASLLPRAKLQALHPAIAKRVIRLWLWRECGRLPEHCHVEHIWKLCCKATSSRACAVSADCTVCIERDALRRLPQGEPVCDVLGALDEPLTMGMREFSDLGWRVTLQNANVSDDSCARHKKNTQNRKNVYNPFIRDTLTFDTIMECDIRDLSWRLRRSGDTLLFRGVNRKLRKLQNEMGVPPRLRDRLPLLCCGDTVLWVPFVGARDGAFSAADVATDRTLCLTIESIFKNTDITKEDLPL